MKTVISVALLNIIFFHSGNAQWGTDTRLTNDPGRSRTTGAHSWCISASGSFLHTTWYDDRDGNREVYYKRSTDNGLTWGSDIRLSNNASDSYTPSISSSGAFVHVIWDDERDGNSEMYYKRSTDNGLTWGADTRLTNDPDESIIPSLASIGSNVHIVWYDTRNETTEIYYKRSTNNGLTWGSDTRLTNEPSQSSYPCIALSGSSVHVVWYDERLGSRQIYYKKSSNNGTNWDAEIPITGITVCQMPSISASGQVVHITWDQVSDIYYTRSQDNGENFESNIKLSFPDAGISEFASMCLSGSIVHVIWRDGRNGSEEIYYKRNVSGNVLPVEMAYLNSSVKENDITINWGTSWELNNSGFSVERKSAAGNDWQSIGFVQGYGTVNEEKHYSFQDNNLIKGKYH